MLLLLDGIVHQHFSLCQKAQKDLLVDIARNELSTARANKFIKLLRLKELNKLNKKRNNKSINKLSPSNHNSKSLFNKHLKNSRPKSRKFY